MLIKKAIGGPGSLDSLQSIIFCCDDMRDEIIIYYAIRLTGSGDIRLKGRNIKFCPHCGKEIIHEISTK